MAELFQLLKQFLVLAISPRDTFKYFLSTYFLNHTNFRDCRVNCSFRYIYRVYEKQRELENLKSF